MFDAKPSLSNADLVSACMFSATYPSDINPRDLTEQDVFAMEKRCRCAAGHPDETERAELAWFYVLNRHNRSDELDRTPDPEVDERLLARLNRAGAIGMRIMAVQIASSVPITDLS